MAEYEEHMDKLLSIIAEYEEITDCHMVDFITENLWEKVVPQDFRLLYENRNVETIDPLTEKINALLLSLQFLFSERYLEKETNKAAKSEFHTEKKWHEIERFSKVIEEMLNHPTVVIDAGAGKGYLSMLLSKDDVPVLAVESSSTTYHGALNYHNLIKKKTHQSFNMIKYAMEHVDENTNYCQLVKTYFPQVHAEGNLTLVGLHTCGSLVHSMAKSFVQKKDVKTLCVVPCCYHLTDKTLNKAYKFTRNQRMLAQQRSPNPSKTDSSPSLFYRAVLQTVIRSLGVENAKIGRGISGNDFPTYATKALKKMGISEEKIPPAECLERTYEMHSNYKWKFDVFQSLRCSMAPVLEAAILMDIFLYIQKNVTCSQLRIEQIFEQSISPRSYAIVAVK